MFHLAPVWGKVGKALPTVRMVPDENHRERVLAAEEETLHFAGAKSEAMNQQMNASLLSDVATILLDCDFGPKSVFGCGSRSGKVEIRYGKTDNARRRIPMTREFRRSWKMRLSSAAGSEWVSLLQRGAGTPSLPPSGSSTLRRLGKATAILRKQSRPFAQ